MKSSRTLIARCRAQLLLLAILCLIFSCHGVAAQQEQVPLQEASKKQPNILFILTDDQDAAMGSLDYMPLLKKYITDEGAKFERHYCTVALCCPSRVSMWTGKAAHNTNVTDVNPPHGGYPKFISQGFNNNYLPVWLQDAGYGTYYVGKLFNAQTVLNYNKPHAAGWTGSDFLLDPYTYRYMNATFQRNHDPPKSYEGKYSPDVVAEKAHGFLEDALKDLDKDDKPFFLTVAPTAPHSDVNIKQTVIDGNFSRWTNVQSPPVPAERHKHLFEDVMVPRTPHFNPEQPGGASWISRLPRQGPKNIAFNDHFYRNRLRALQAVDEMVESLVKRLDEAGVLDNTYVFYSTDNGYHIGQHRLQPGKQCAFEEDINIPLIVRGPGIGRGVVTDIVTSHTDLAPTFLSLAGISSFDEFGFDGTKIPLTSPERGFVLVDGANPLVMEGPWRQEHVNVEMWGIIMSEGRFGSVLYPNHTYKALRVIGGDYNFLYTVWCSGEHELYDLKTDPYEMDNVYKKDLSTSFPLRITTRWIDANNSTPLPDLIATANATSITSSDDSESRTLANLVHRLDSLLMVLKTCKGRECTHPWESLHPEGGVGSLGDALDSKYDSQYEQFYKHAKVEYQKCEKGYIAESEQPEFDGGHLYGMFDEVAYA